MKFVVVTPPSIYQILTYCTGITYVWARNGYLLGHDADLFWLVSTYVAVIIFVCPKLGIYLGTEGVPIPLVHFMDKNLWRPTFVEVALFRYRTSSMYVIFIFTGLLFQ